MYRTVRVDIHANEVRVVCEIVADELYRGNVALVLVGDDTR